MRRLSILCWFAMMSFIPAFALGKEAAAPAQSILYLGLGDLSRQVTTKSPEAQIFFNQGLAFMYGFNHDEAIRSFQQAALLDPDCAMAHWGIALANGPHINNPVLPPDRAADAMSALRKAQSAVVTGSDVEKSLVEALASRYAEPATADRAGLDAAYAEAMRAVWKRYPKDPDVGALFAESMMDLRPWDLWTLDSKPQPGTPEIVETLESVLAIAPKHPLANHLYIHAIEASPQPEKADQAADTLRDLQPGLGHMVHMPSHIDLRRGRWAQAITANIKAIEADRRYTEQSPVQNFYHIYMAHNFGMLSFAAMMNGQSKLALSHMREMVAGIPAEFIQANPVADGMVALPMEVMMRFGMWDEILAEPNYPDYAPFSKALRHFIRAVAYAAKGDIPSSKNEQGAFIVARTLVPRDTPYGNNMASTLLELSGKLLAGEIQFRDGQQEEGLKSLRDALAIEDQLRYDEPPDWMIPVRHSLAAALLEAGQYDEAEMQFRADLVKWPHNGWGLFGLSRALDLQGKHKEAKEVHDQFKTAWKDADIVIKSSCLCQPGV